MGHAGAIITGSSGTAQAKADAFEARRRARRPDAGRGRRARAGRPVVTPAGHRPAALAGWPVAAARGFLAFLAVAGIGQLLAIAVWAVGDTGASIGAFARHRVDVLRGVPPRRDPARGPRSRRRDRRDGLRRDVALGRGGAAVDHRRRGLAPLPCRADRRRPMRRRGGRARAPRGEGRAVLRAAGLRARVRSSRSRRRCASARSRPASCTCRSRRGRRSPSRSSSRRSPGPPAGSAPGSGTGGRTTGASRERRRSPPAGGGCSSSASPCPSAGSSSPASCSPTARRRC